MTKTDPYKTLGVAYNASLTEIKSAYRKLVKKHHPDTGGDASLILEINSAWAILKDQHIGVHDNNAETTHQAKKQGSNYKTAKNIRTVKQQSSYYSDQDEAILRWFNHVYLPIDQLLSAIINPFSSKLKSLSADPYDESLMDNFCRYIEISKKKIKKANELYISKKTPRSIQDFSLHLYNCISELEESLEELERYTMGYVDNYLHDGHEMLRDAKKKRLYLKEIHRNIR